MGRVWGSKIRSCHYMYVFRYSECPSQYLFLEAIQPYGLDHSYSSFGLSLLMSEKRLKEAFNELDPNDQGLTSI